MLRTMLLTLKAPTLALNNHHKLLTICDDYFNGTLYLIDKEYKEL